MTKTLAPDFPVFKIGEGDAPWELLREMNPDVDTAGRQYRMVGQFLENNDFYQGLCMITVVRRIDDGKLFGYSWWDDISKYGESFMEPNGDEFGLEGYCEVEDDWDTFISYWVFEPVEQYNLPAYRKMNDES